MLKEIIHVFSKEYRDETKFLEFKQKMLSKMKLKSYDGKSVDELIEVLRNKNFESNCHIAVGEF